MSVLAAATQWTDVAALAVLVVGGVAYAWVRRRFGSTDERDTL